MRTDGIFLRRAGKLLRWDVTPRESERARERERERERARERENDFDFSAADYGRDRGRLGEIGGVVC
jgi:hypothetical protein